MAYNNGRTYMKKKMTLTRKPKGKLVKKKKALIKKK